MATTGFHQRFAIGGAMRRGYGVSGLCEANRGARAIRQAGSI
jgi:hypothetical protein